jgi:peptidoglycan/xylan/chitin deacetylase (PgdA/CDA1 family)
MILMRLVPNILRAEPRIRTLGRVSGADGVALTFDDGPSDLTAAALSVLARHGARATFFVVGREIPGRERLLRRAVDEGHEIGNHTMSHAHAPVRRRRAYDELAGTSELVATAVGAAPRLYRPPYGELDQADLSLALELGMSPVAWDVDPRDWSPGVSADAIRTRLLDAVQPGSVILLHDGPGAMRAATLAALPSILDALGERGLESVTVSELIARRHATVAGGA